ncbi:TetR family transcriptional regulator [Modestobacter sp. VKM Ac-2979]|uniref:TetR family transcriptional regulator n=1 Tax=unclassified Modestobacter TaxID=2643866 RepID=UPI0022AB7976|nr:MULTISPECIES: TetR family transcriptional regulator [unclassified Modestobacter]MCZ2811999.1 TetR family transcriptional regulator [Modestobacter sp. VKM Ac-2979]MCZ2843723.1 TetR family transcriptional regulator [Modestobacter sp. VKM Ac-2980]
MHAVLAVCTAVAVHIGVQALVVLRVIGRKRRVELAGAAMRVREREGAGSPTTRALAKEAGVPLSAVHDAFDSTADLVCGLPSRSGAGHCSDGAAR